MGDRDGREKVREGRRVDKGVRREKKEERKERKNRLRKERRNEREGIEGKELDRRTMSGRERTRRRRRGGRGHICIPFITTTLLNLYLVCP